ncbi:TPA: hypothetical protein QHB43_001193 [Aeromonas hydrophila subsp. hydrophila]|nr:hypothetical protein [Aeromonas hydrophila subsp. hydrophila]
MAKSQKKSSAQILREKILNNKSKEAMVTLNGVEVLIKQPTQLEIKKLSQIIPADISSQLDESTLLFLIAVRDPETRECLFTYKDLDDISEITAEFYTDFIVEYNKAFAVTSEEIEGNSTGTESV